MVRTLHFSRPIIGLQRSREDRNRYEGRRQETKKTPFDLFVGWRNFDDEYVTSLASEKELNRPDAYVLFYRHRNLPIQLNLPTPPPQPPAVTTTTTSTFTPLDTFDEPISMETNTLDDIRDLLS